MRLIRFLAGISLWLLTVAAFAQVNKGEYFFDTDPGIGNGFSFAISSSADSVVVTPTISISSLSSGFHTLYLRTRMNKKWSQTESRSFYILSSSSTVAGPVSQIEYFFDTDPGVGLGTKLTVNPAADSVVRTAIIPITGLSAGFHTLYCRAKNNYGYGLTESRTFFITSQTGTSAGPVSQLEYFFDSDPGVGSGTKININPSADSTERTAVIPITGLASGFHTLYIRAKNNTGYGHTEARSFFVLSSTTSSSGPVSRMEFFVDNDPGPGNGTPVPSFTSADSVDLNRVITLPSNLSQGDHKLYIRSKTSDNRWSLTEVQNFTVDCGEIFIQASSEQICAGHGTVLSPIQSLSGTFQWYRNGVLISGATQSAFTASQTGTYTLAYTNGSCADTSDALVITEGPCAQKPGSGNALSFNGGNSSMTIPQGVVQAYTIECWVKFTANPANRNIIGFTSGNLFSTWSHQIRTNENGQFTHYTFDGGGKNIQGSTSVLENQWYHVAITATNSGVGRLYVNGIQEGGEMNIGTLWTGGNQYHVGTGSGGFGLASASALAGEVDEIRIWNTAMNATQIRERMCRKITFSDALYSNLVRYLNLDETEGSIAYILNDLSVTASLVNNPGRVTSGAPIGNASAQQYVSTGLPAANLTFNGQDNFSVNYTGGTFTGTAGTHVYVVNEKPNSESGIDNAGTNNRYFGVFNANLSNPQYTAVYNYTNNPFVTAGNENSLSLFKRVNNAASLWANAGATLNTTANTLTATGQNTEYMIGTSSATISPGLIGNNQTFSCATAPPALLENLASATTTSGNPITYLWQDSIVGGTWQNIANSNATTFQPPFLTASRWYRRRAQAGSFVAFSNIVEIIVSQAIAGDPAVFPQDSWNVYGYSGEDLNLGPAATYRGFYSVNSVNINTQNQWSGNLSPSAAANYQGCSIPNDNFTFVLKRKGFPVGTYLLNIVDHDDNIRVYLNGNQIFEHLGCCDGHPNITLGNLDANSTIEVRIQEGVGFSQVNLVFTESDLNPGVISGNQTICGSSTPSAFVNTQSASGGTTPTITYQWQDSTAGGSWQNIANAVNASFQAGVLTQTTWFRRIALNAGEQAISNQIQVTITSVAGDPTIFPTNDWNMYAYSGGDFNLGNTVTYLGFYPVSGLIVNSANQWNPNASPSSAPGYQGCPVPNDNFIFTLKRRGFPTGQYTMNITVHDDWVRVLVDGNQVFEHLSCCDSHSGIDLGTLDENSTIEVRTLEGGGSAQIAFELIPSAFQGGSIAADQSICGGIAPAALTGVTEAFGGGAGAITYQWQDSTSGGSWQNISGANGLGFQPGVLNSTHWFIRKATAGNLVAFSNAVQITVLSGASASVSPVGPFNLCEGSIQVLIVTVSPGNTIKWLRNDLVISGQTQPNLTVFQAGTYKAVALSGGTCTDTSNAVVVNFLSKPTPTISPTGTVTICDGGQATFTYTQFQTGQTLRWKDENSNIIGTGVSVNVSTTGAVYLVVTNQNGCKDSSGLAFVQVVNPSVGPVGPVSFCSGGSTNLTLSGAGSATIQWFRNGQLMAGQSNPILVVNQPGSYQAQVTLLPACSLSTNTVVVNENALPIASITSNGTVFCQGGSLLLEANEGQGLTYQWRRNGQNISQATQSTFSANQPGDYTVVVTNSNNCSATSSIVAITQLNNQTWFIDADGDGYGTGNSLVNCVRPANGFLASELVATTGDCNDNNPTINPSRQFFSFSPNSGFTNSLCSPLTGTPYTNFRFEVKYTDLNNGALPATFPRVILDFEGNGSFTGPNDRTILMNEFDNRDETTSDGKIYIASINSLVPGTNYTTRVLSTIGGCATEIGPFNYPDVLVLPDLQIFANDISFSQNNPPVSSPLTVSAVIHNVSDFAAENFVVHLVNQFDPSIDYGDIVVPFIAPHTSQTVQWNIITPAVPAWCPMQVFVDWTNVIEESNELDNSAIRPFINGNFNLPGSISPTLSISPATTNPGGTVTVSGTAIYTGTAVPLADPSVAGAQVTITINQTGATYTTFTNASGQFSFPFPAPVGLGTYTVTIVITDFTLSSTTVLTFTVVPAQCLPDLVTSIVVSSNNIIQGESLNGQFTIRNVGCQDVADSTLFGITQSGGTPAIPSQKIGPLAKDSVLKIPFSGITFNTPGLFSICGTADAGFVVQESNESNNGACAVINVIPFLPDIYPYSCGSGNRYVSDEIVQYGFSIANSGGSATGPFTARVRIFLNGVKIDSVDHLVPNIGRQSGYNFSLPIAFDQVGTYFLEIQADIPVATGGVVVETVENNNVASCVVNVLPTFADLNVQGCGRVKVIPVDPAFPGTVQYQATVRNDGNATAVGPIPVQFKVGNQTPVTINVAGNLAPGQTIVVNSGNQASVAPGTQKLVVKVNPEGTVNESTFGNNSDSSQLCHDFQPVDIPPICGSNFWNSTYRINQAVFLWCGLVQNYYYDASQVRVRFLVSGPGLNGTLNLGDAVVNNMSRTCGCPVYANLPTSFVFPEEGEYTFTLIADPDNVYTECDEDNNVIIRKVQVSGLPDMRILSQMINPSKLNPQPDEPITISVSYENIGTSNINQTMMLKVLVDEVPLDSSIVEGLVTGDNGTVDFTTPWSSDVVGSHVIRTIIDSRNQILEVTKVNNEATRAVIVGDAANLYFQVFVPSNGSPAFGSSITLTARIGNNGDEATNAQVVFFFINNQGDTVQIGQQSFSVNGNDSVTVSIPWTVINPTTTLIAKIINSEISEFNYDDNVATTQIGLFSVNLTATPACAGQPNGTLTTSITGGAEPFTFLWSNGFTGPVLTSGPGLYSVLVTDNNGLIVQKSGSIPNQPGTRLYQDADGDGYGNPLVDTVVCAPFVGYVSNKLDCNDSDPGVYKSTDKPVIVSNGGLVICTGTQVLLSVQQPINGYVYIWSNNQTGNSIQVSSPGPVSVTASQDSGCAAVSDPVLIDVVDQLTPTASISSSIQGNICKGSLVVFNASVSGEGVQPSLTWYLNNQIVASGLSYPTDSLKNGDQVRFELISSEACSVLDTAYSNVLTMTVLDQPFANAGFGQSICGNSTQLTANSVNGALGTWTVVAGTGQFEDVHDPLSMVFGLSNGINRFRWTLDNGACPPNSDLVIITVSPQGVVPLAGPDQSICQAGFTTLAANSPGTGTGEWTVLSGTGVINNASQFNSLVTNLAFGENKLIWTVTAGTCEPLSDTVVITRFETPADAEAGPDQSICGSQTTLQATPVQVGQGEWSLISGSGNIAQITNPQSAVSGLGLGENVLVWSVTNGVCNAKTDTVVIEVTPGGPSPANAGPDQDICGDTTRLAAETPAVGLGAWTIVSGNVIIADTSQTDSHVELLSPGVHVLVWTVSEGTCSPTTDTVRITRFEAPGQANAGADQSLCQSGTSLNGNTPTIGLGQWTVTIGNAILENPGAANTQVSNLDLGINEFVWTISNGSCEATTDTVLILREQGSLLADAGEDQSICGDTTQLAGVLPDQVSGIWTVLEGDATIENPSEKDSRVFDLSIGINRFIWTLSGGQCGDASDTVTIIRNETPTTANAGTDQVICGTETVLDGNVPQVGTGSWSVLSGTAIVTDPQSANSTVTNLSVGENVLVWSISNGDCPASTDTVTITVEPAPSTASAGTDQTICGTETVLDGNVPQVGTGSWSVVSGTAIVADPQSANSTVTNLSAGENVLVWSISNGDCPASTDTVSITVEPIPTTANAGSDQTICSTETVLDGNAPQVGAGTWSVVSGTAIVADPQSANSTVTNLSEGENVLVWSISNGDCPASTDTVTITVEPAPTTANAGTDQTICSTETVLDGNVPQVGTGTWSVVSGTAIVADPQSANSTVTNLSGGENVLVWTISNGDCPASTDTVTVTVEPAPTTANAGTDQTICGTETVLDGNAPQVGAGTWSVVSGTAIVTDPQSANSTVTNLSVGENVLIWSISNGDCPASTDTVSITVEPAPTTANAGTDQTICGTETILDGNVPQVGTGTWSVVSGTAIVADPQSANSTVTNLSGGENVLVWTISNGDCPASTDTVTITVEPAPTTANAGTDQTICSTETVLDGNVPQVGAGVWTVVSGTGDIGNPGSANTTISNLGLGINQFAWTISNGICPASSDTVQISVSLPYALVDAGPDSAICGSEFTLQALAPAQGSWTVLTGGGQISNPAQATTLVTNLQQGQNVFIWVAQSGGCAIQRDTVIITSNQSFAANAGAGVISCSDTSRLQAPALNAPATGFWTLVSGNGQLEDPTQHNSKVTGLGEGLNVFRWTVSVPTCPDVSDTTSIVRIPNTLNIGPDTIVCIGDSLTLTVPPGFTGFTWSNGWTGSSLTLYAGDTLVLAVTTAQNCTFTDTIRVQFEICGSVKGKLGQPYDVAIHPNPASNQVWMQIKAKKPGTARLTVINALGQQMGATQEIWTEGETIRDLDTSEWPSGMYTLMLTDGQSQWTGKLLIKR